MNRTEASYRERSRVPKPEPIDVELADMADSYARSCKARGLSDETVAIYRAELGKLSRYLHEQGMPTDVGLIRREHIESWLIELQGTYKPASVSMSFRSCRTFFRWCVDEDELVVSPMARMRAPTVPVESPAVITQKQMDTMLDSCRGTSFDDRRDRALLMLLGDTGIRRGEVVNLDLPDVLLAQRVAIIRGEGSKSRRDRTVAFGDATASALDRYLRARGRHAHASSPAFFIGRFGRLGDSGVLTMVKRRGKLAGIPALHPHIFRHTWAHETLSSGMTEGDVMVLGGWRDRSMLDRYGAVAKTERAISAHRQLSPMDRLVKR